MAGAEIDDASAAKNAARATRDLPGLVELLARQTAGMAHGARDAVEERLAREASQIVIRQPGARRSGKGGRHETVRYTDTDVMTFLNGPTLCVAAVLLLQSAPAQPVRFGYQADRLTAADIEQIGALAPQPQSRPWVLVTFGPNFLPSMPWFVDAFLEPDRTTPSVRRGRMMTVKTTTPAKEAYERPRVWSLERMAEYAQVPARGNDAGVQGAADLNRPFRVLGVFSDDDLAELARLVRASPPNPSFKGAAGAMGSHVEGSWPIGLVLRRDDGSVEIDLLRPEQNKQGQRVQVRRDDVGWTVVQVNYWVAD